MKIIMKTKSQLSKYHLEYFIYVRRLGQKYAETLSIEVVALSKDQAQEIALSTIPSDLEPELQCMYTLMSVFDITLGMKIAGVL